MGQFVGCGPVVLVDKPAASSLLSLCEVPVEPGPSKPVPLLKDGSMVPARGQADNAFVGERAGPQSGWIVEILITLRRA